MNRSFRVSTGWVFWVSGFSLTGGWQATLSWSRLPLDISLPQSYCPLRCPFSFLAPRWFRSALSSRFPIPYPPSPCSVGHQLPTLLACSSLSLPCLGVPAVSSPSSTVGALRSPRALTHRFRASEREGATPAYLISVTRTDPCLLWPPSESATPEKHERQEVNHLAFRAPHKNFWQRRSRERHRSDRRPARLRVCSQPEGNPKVDRLAYSSSGSQQSVTVL